jgi:hypothetical protein
MHLSNNHASLSWSGAVVTMGVPSIICYLVLLWSMPSVAAFSAVSSSSVASIASSFRWLLLYDHHHHSGSGSVYHVPIPALDVYIYPDLKHTNHFVMYCGPLFERNRNSRGFMSGEETKLSIYILGRIDRLALLYVNRLVQLKIFAKKFPILISINITSKKNNHIFTYFRIYLGDMVVGVVVDDVANL